MILRIIFFCLLDHCNRQKAHHKSHKMEAEFP